MSVFFTAALPFVLIGLALALLFAFQEKRKKNYMIPGFCTGAVLGGAGAFAGLCSASAGIGMGMLAGESLGMLIPKK